MKDPAIEILLVDADTDLVGMIADHLGQSIDIGPNGSELVIRQASSAEEALSALYARPPEVVLTELELPDQDGLSMIRSMRDHADCAILVMPAQVTLGKAVELMRLGARDLFVKPFDLRRLTEAVQQAVQDQLGKRRSEHRQQRLQQLASRIVRERRELRKRVDLVCHDLVGAYRDLANKFVEHTGEHAEKL